MDRLKIKINTRAIRKHDFENIIAKPALVC